MLSVLGGGSMQSQSKKRARPKDGNVEVEFGPEKNNNRSRKKTADDGDYIEFEEVK